MDNIIWRWHDMIVDLEDNIIRVVILDISGIYVQIHNQGYFDENTIKDIQQQYSDTEHWKVFILE